MLRVMCAICICLATFSVFCQAASKYEVATITDVKRHPPTGDDASSAASYDVWVTVGATTYLVLYTDPMRTDTVKYAAGRNLLVLVGKKTITYNDILGRSLEVPILSRKTAADGTQPK